MSAAALHPGHDALLPRAPGGNGTGLLLALAVHAGLAAALTVSVDWRARAPEVVAAELWASVPQAAAPEAAAPPPAPSPAPLPLPPVPAPPPQAAAPAPPPAEPDIATQRAERRRAEDDRKKAEADVEAARRRAQAAEEAERQRLVAERKRVEDEKKRRDKAEAAAAVAREAKAEEERLAKQRDENLRRMMAQAGSGAGTITGTGAATSAGTAAQSAAPSAAYSGRLVALIRGNLVFTGSTPDNSAAEVEVSAAAGGAIIARRLVKSSGHADWDEAVLRAIDRTATLPRDADGRVPPRLIIAFRPRE